MRTIAAFCLSLTLLPALVSSAHAQGGLFWGANGFYGNGGIISGPQPYIPAPPYFALHPPVYYGKRYVRPYGASPFASRSMLNSNPAYAPELAPAIRQYPVEHIVNPYHTSAALPKPALAEQAKPKAGPRVIENPYFREESVQYTVH